MQAASVLNESKYTVIQITGDPGDNYSLAVRQGFDTEFLGYNYVFTKPALDWEPANALKVVIDYERMTKTLDNVGVIFAHSAELLTPIVHYLQNRANSKRGDSSPKLISANGAPSAISNIANRIQWAEIEQPMYAQVYGMALIFAKMKIKSREFLHEKEGETRSICILNSKGTLVFDSKRGAILKLAGRVIDSTISISGDSSYWGNFQRPHKPINEIGCAS
jgi:ribose transport system substrate-binding protein